MNRSQSAVTWMPSYAVGKSLVPKQSRLATDNIFSDGYSLQLATVTGSVDDGYTISLNVPV